MSKYTRKQYMSNLGESKEQRWENHRRYYAQFVDDEVKRRVLAFFGPDRIKKYFKLGGSPSEAARELLPLSKWDAVGLPTHTANKFKELGDSFSMSGMTCVNKEAARQIAEEMGAI